MAKVDILGVRVDNPSFQEAIDKITGMVNRGGRYYVVTANPEMVVEAQKNEEFKEVLYNADLVVPDGIGLLSAAQFLTDNAQKKQNVVASFFKYLSLLLSTFFNHKRFRVISHTVSGSDLTIALAKWAEKEQVPVVLLGGLPGEAAGASLALKSDFPKLELIVDEGPVDASAIQTEENERIIHKLSVVNRAFVFVAFGHPKQELWIARNFEYLPQGVAMGVGGTFAFLSGRKRRAHPALRKFGLEWLWRLVIEPSRWKRIFTATVVFPYVVFRGSRN